MGSWTTRILQTMRKFSCFCTGRVLMSAIRRRWISEMCRRRRVLSGRTGFLRSLSMGLGRNGTGRGEPQWCPKSLEFWMRKSQAVWLAGSAAPPLPLDRQNMQEADVATPPRREVNGHRGLRAPGSWLPQRGTRVAPQIFTDARARDVSSDHRNVPWSPENILIDTVARLQQDLPDIRAEFRQFRTPGVPSVVLTTRQAAFTTTKVPRFGGTTSWEQYRCNRLRCPLARMSGLQCFNMGHNGHGINLYGVSMTLMENYGKLTCRRTI